MVWMSRRPPGPGLHVRLEVVGGVVGLQVPLVSARAPWPRRTPSPARCGRRRCAARICASSRRCRASSRASISVVMTPTSAALSCAHSSTVRTLWPTSRPMSQRNVTKRLDALRPAALGRARGTQQQDVDVGAAVQLAAAVAADRHERPARDARSAKCSASFAQDDRSTSSARACTSVSIGLVRARSAPRAPRALAWQQRSRNGAGAPCASARQRGRRGASSGQRSGAARAARARSQQDLVADVSAAAGTRRASAPRTPLSRHEHGVLPLRRQRVILGDDGPAVGQQPHVALARVDHRLDGNRHPGHRARAPCRGSP